MNAQVGDRIVHRCYVSFDQAHYAGNLVDGAWSLARFGDAATELCIVSDGAEGLLAGYDEVRFHAPVRGGDVVEISAETVAVGTRSRRIRFSARVTARGASTPQRPGASRVLDPPLVVTSANGTVVIPGQ